MRRVLIGSVLASALALTGCAGSGMYAATPVVTLSAGSPSADARVGTTIVPAEERTETIVIAGEAADGTALSTADFGGDIVVVNAWASWCPPCIEELPLLAAAASDFADDGVAFVGLNSLDDPIAAASLLGSSIYRSIDDRDGSILAKIPGVPPRSLPSTVVLDRSGRVAARIIGPIKPGQLESVLETLVKESPA